MHLKLVLILTLVAATCLLERANANAKCSQLSQRCLKCSKNGRICRSCEKGYFIDSSGKCQACPDNCPTCFNDTYCTSCEENFGFEVYDFGDKQERYCAQCLTFNCLDCENDWLGCNTCVPGYKWSGSWCVSKVCSFGCADCPSGRGNCTKCKSGFRFNDQGKCEACAIHGCAECPNGKMECTKCQDSYKECILTDPPPKCRPCEEPQCKRCSKKTGRCLECNPGYYSKKSKCINCRAVISNCISCDNKKKCSQCDPGYSFNDKTAKCIKQVSEK